MSFITKNSQKKKNSGVSTRWINLGIPRAEGEKEELKEYYEDFLQINNAIDSNKFIITGRKGVGKSAYVQYLQNNSCEENKLYCRVVTNDIIELEKMIQSVPDTVENKYEIIYEWIILTEMVRLIISNENAQCSKGYKELQKFEQKNRGLANVEQWEVVEITEGKQATVNYSDLWKVFPAAFSASINKKTVRAPFYTLIMPLRSIVTQMLTYEVFEDYNLILFFDDLDLQFNLNDKNDKDKLISLIRIATRYNTQYFPKRDVKVINLLRDDIARQIGSSAPDINNIFKSHEYRLNWYDTITRDDENTRLRKFINKRIKVCFDKLNISYNRSDPWQSLVENEPCDEYRNNTAFKYILDFTFYRPRDLVAFFNNIGDETYPMPLNPQDIKKLLKNYLEWSINEIKAELSNLYTDEEKEHIFNVFRNMAQPYSQWTYNSIIEFLQNEGLNESVFEKLLEYNFIVPKDEKGFQFFSYRENPRVEKSEKYFYCLPKCIYSYYTQDYYY